PRFADAQFFYDEDLNQGLTSMREGLASVTYQQKLGSYADKSVRVAALADAIAEEIGGDTEQARRAAKFPRADLKPRMGGDFRRRRGVRGPYPATAKGKP